jgi:DNA-binding GntR family transcriptional regulator
MRGLASDGVVTERGRKSDAVFEELRSSLLRGTLRFGETFSTYGLAEQLNTSRRPVMDALARLESAGFVEIIPQVGCRVVVPDATKVREHFELAAALEGTAAMLSAERASDEQVARMQDTVARTLDVLHDEDVTTFVTLNRELHAAILEASGNETLAQHARQAWDLSDFYLHPRRTSDVPLAHTEHERIIDAIARRDPTAAREAMESHIRRFFHSVQPLTP